MRAYAIAKYHKSGKYVVCHPTLAGAEAVGDDGYIKPGFSFSPDTRRLDTEAEAIAALSDLQAFALKWC